MLSEPAWGPTGKSVYERTYRRNKQNGELETWNDTVTRVVDGNLGLVDSKYHEKNEREKLIDLFYNFKALPAGRHLWMSGVPGRQFLFNCHHSGWEDDVTTHFTFTFDQLMQGGGVGANYSNRYIKRYKPLKNHVDVHVVCDPEHPDYEELSNAVLEYGPDGAPLHGNLLSEDYSFDWTGSVRVEDTREGWYEALAKVLNAFWAGTDQPLVFDVSLIRHRGSKIKSFGGTAAGPAPLAILLLNVAERLNGRVGEKITSMDAMLVDHFIATCVVSGNVRRSARMSIKHWNDTDIMDFINCKQGSQGHWSTNISVEIDEAFFRAIKRKDEHALSVYRAVVEGMLTNGEPGFYNRTLAQEGEVGEVASTNPCGEIALEQFENCFAGSERFLTKEFGAVPLSEVVGETVTVMTESGWTKAEVNYFGSQAVQNVHLVPVRLQGQTWQRTRSNFTVDLTVTPNHRWKLTDGAITSELKVGDVVPTRASSINEHSAEYQDGVRHGIVFGDGSISRMYANGDYSVRVRFYGAKAEEMASYFEKITYPAKAGVAEGWLRTATNMKEFPTTVDPNYLGGFLHGWMLADGSDRPGGGVHLGSTNPDADRWLRENAAQGGWVLRASRDSGVEETNLGVRKNPLRFFTLVKPSESVAWRVEGIEALPDAIPVYCATVPGEENFTLASGVATMNCNLGHVNLDAFHHDFEGAIEAHRLMTRYLLRATFGDVPNPRQREVLSRNRRIGVGHFGFQGWLNKQGVRYSDSHRNQYIRKTLRDFYDAVRREGRRYAFQLRIPEPIKVTTVAPTGTIAKLAGRSEGIHPIYAKYFIRRVRYSTVDPGQLEAIREFELKGQTVVDDIYAPNTKVVEFITKESLVQEVDDLGLDGDLIVESADEIALADMLAVQAMYQECYADNAVSFTVNFPAGSLSVAEAMATMLHYLPYLKGTTLMPDGTRPLAPYERISKAEYELAKFVEVGDGLDENCSTGACPVK